MVNQLVPYNNNGSLSQRLFQQAVSYAAVATTLGQVTNYIRNLPDFARASASVRNAVYRRIQSWWNSKSSNMIESPIIAAPVAYSSTRRVPKPRFRSTSGGVIIHHREYLADISGNTTFGVDSWTVQPGIASSFPWLSSIANNFEKYTFRRLSFSYINVSATDERGRITMAYDKDPLDADPTAKYELFQYSGAVEGSVWTRLEHNVPISGTFFTRAGTVEGSDLKTYDAGKFIVGVSSTADTAIVGELFVDYEVELTVPQPAKCPSMYISSDTGVTNLAVFGTSRTITGNLAATVEADKIIFNTVGTFAVTLQVFDAGGPGAVTRNLGTAEIIGPTNISAFNGDGGSANTKSVYLTIYRVTVPGQTVQFSCAGSVSTSDTVITMY